MAVRLIALDIDGTLVPHGELHASERVSRAVTALQDAGIAIVLASGRMYPGTRRIAEELGISTPLICQQGCAIHHPGGGLLHEFPLDGAIARDLVHYARTLDAPYEWFNPLRYLASRETEASKQYAILSGVTPEYVAEPEESGLIPTGVGVITSRSRAPGVHRELVHLHGDQLHVLDFPDVTVAVAPDANKGHALSLLCDDVGIDRHETLAIGDSVNDAAMLAWAGRGVAMHHSDAYAVDAADERLDAHPDALAMYLEAIAKRQRGD